MTSAAAARAPRSRATLVLVALVALAGIVGFARLGVWQVERLFWKKALIERVEARIHAPPIAAPGPAGWADIAEAEYTRVSLTGHFLHEREALVQAVTERGAGSWVLTPLVTDSDFTVLVNRGFVPPERRERASRAQALPEGTVTVTGLLRLSEPGGGFLRANAPAEDRWHSRDVAAIAAARSLSPVAPYFVDADATPNPGGFPVGGLTVVRFSDNHLVYAVTWFALAAMVAAALAFVLRHEARLRRAREQAD